MIKSTDTETKSIEKWRKNLRAYVKKYFKEAFKIENRDYNENQWSFEWIMIKNSNGTFQLYSVMWCKFGRIKRYVEQKLQKYLLKDFGIHYGDTEQMRCQLYDGGTIDYNHTQAMFNIKGKNVSLSVFDKNTNIFENGLSGECMPAYTYEKLLFKYWSLNAETYSSLPEDDKRHSLPNLNWDEYKNLYSATFDKSIGSVYEIIYSSGIECK